MLKTLRTPLAAALVSTALLAAACAREGNNPADQYQARTPAAQSTTPTNNPVSTLDQNNARTTTNDTGAASLPHADTGATTRATTGESPAKKRQP